MKPMNALSTLVIGTSILLGAAGTWAQNDSPPPPTDGSRPDAPVGEPALPPPQREIHVLRVEFLSRPAPDGNGPMEVVVDGEPLPPEQAHFMADIVTRLRGAIFGEGRGDRPDHPFLDRWRDRAGNRPDGGVPPDADDRFQPGSRGVRPDGSHDGGFGDWTGDSGPGQNWFAPDMGLGSDSQPLDDDTIKNILIVIGDVNPTLQAQLIDLRNTDQTLFEQRMRDSARQWRELIRLRGTDPDGYRNAVENAKLIQQRMELMRAWFEAGKAGDDARKAQIKSQLRDVLGRQFDNRNEKSQQEVARLEEQLKHLKESLADRESKRDQVIDRQLEMITNGPRRQPMSPREVGPDQPASGGESSSSTSGGGGG